MWKVKTFKTAQRCNDWCAKNESRFWIETLFVNNGFAVQYKPLRSY